MARKKERIFSFEFPEESSQFTYNNKLINFISKESNIFDNFKELDKQSILSEPKNKKDLENIIKTLGTKQLNFVGNEAIYIEELSLFKPLKSSDGYIYRLRDYNENKHVFYGFNEIISYLKRKVKTKIVNLSYNGINETIEFSEKELSNILIRMTNGTHDILVVQIDSKNKESNLILITPFKLFG